MGELLVFKNLIFLDIFIMYIYNTNNYILYFRIPFIFATNTFIICNTSSTNSSFGSFSSSLFIIIIFPPEYLCDTDKIHLLKCNKLINNLKYHIFFNKQVYLWKIINLNFYGGFINVIIDDKTLKFVN